MQTDTKIVWICCDPLSPVPLDLQKDKQLIFGRHKAAGFQLPHSCVSREHASLKTISGRCLLLEDLGSSNGTFVNGKKVSAFPVELGDIIQIGPYELEIRSKPFNQDNSKYGATNTDFLTTSRAATMAGHLEKTSLVEILQSIEFNCKTGTLYIDGKDRDGFLVFVSGKPISAQFGDLLNVPAVLDMLKISKGNFVLTDKVEPMDMGINTSITRILLEFSRIQDEKPNVV
jgi:hypothetical protein